MAKQELIIVESPTKANTVARFLGGDFQVLATMGHLRDLPSKTLGVDIEHDFAPDYELVSKKKTTISKLKAVAKTASKIYLATDPDREGEAIAWHTAWILNLLGKKTKIPYSRITFHEITRSAIDEAIAHPSEINFQLVDAQQARRVLDRLVGYKLSPLLWQKIRRGLSAGRVQSVAVKLIVEKEREIEKFKAEEYWEVFCRLFPDGRKKEAFLAKLVSVAGKKAVIANGGEAKKITEDLQIAKYRVESVDQKEVAQKPSAPFTTSTLQQKASQVMRFSSKRTMQIAQSLYEKGLITYHRTDSTNLAAEAVEKIRRYIDSTYGSDFLPETSKIYKTKSKVAQEAHEAIRPTEFKKEPEGLGRDEARLYQLIFKKAVASQMNDAVWLQTKNRILASGKNEYGLLAEGKIIKFSGWLVLYGKKEGMDDSGQILPKLATDEVLGLDSVDPQQKFTQPPARYTEATLIKTLEEKGIGRPSTYAPTISTIQIRQYVEKEEGRFHPTALGITVNDFLIEHFADIFDYGFTAQMEDDLDNIAKGEKKWVPVIKDFFTPFSKKLDKVKKAKRVQVPVEKTGEKCPKCGKGDLIIRVGRFGKFIACSNFPECKHTAPYVPSLSGVTCPDCGGEVVVKRTKKGKQFYGCGNYPKCKWASWRKPKAAPAKL